MNVKNLSFYILGITMLLNTSCGKINLLSLEDEKQLGLQSKGQIEADPKQFPILNRNASASAANGYKMLESMRDAILRSGQVEYANEFAWELKIIKDDKTLNAFCTPGGYIYVYTGLMKYLDNSSSLAGVMGHEMAHADRRHSGKQMTEQMGLQVLLAVVAGTQGQDVAQMVNIAAGLTGLAFSRDHENDADAYSVKYLCPTPYQTDGAANFFEKLVSTGQSGQEPPRFLSTHPPSQTRVDNIKTAASQSGNCFGPKAAGGTTVEASYKSIVNGL